MMIILREQELPCVKTTTLEEKHLCALGLLNMYL